MALAGTANALTERQPAQSLFSPLTDFLCLGGGALLLLPILTIVIPDSANGSVVLLALVLSSVVNHPHFIHSYQIFYRTFRDVCGNTAIDRTLRARYVVAGIAVPIILVLYFAVALVLPDLHLLSYSIPAMFFFVGWHYVKQGFGMLMVDAAMKRCFFSPRDRRALLLNSYLCWIASWLQFNREVTEQNFMGLAYATFNAPDALLWISLLGLAGTSAWSAVVLFRHARMHGERAPINGIAAYVAALYPWLFLANEPVLGALIPFMHSLQYEIVIWRFQLNVERSAADAAQRPHPRLPSPLNWSRAGRRFAGFMVRAIVIGGMAFWLLPFLLQIYVPYDTGLRGESLFFLLASVFINIHHYFIDNAMWRKENPHTLRFVMSPR